MFIYFFSLAIKKFDAIIILLMRRVWETKHLFFLAKVSRTSHMNTLHVYSHVPAVTSCSNFSPVTTSWLFDTALFYYQYVNILILYFFIALLGVGIGIKIPYFCTWENIMCSCLTSPILNYLKFFFPASWIKFIKHVFYFLSLVKPL